jgi:hypothetical protein
MVLREERVAHGLKEGTDDAVVRRSALLSTLTAKTLI